MKSTKLALFLCASLLSTGSLAAPSPAAAWTQLPTGTPAVPPGGFLGFCAKHLSECLSKSQEPSVLELTDARRRTLEDVQRRGSGLVRPQECDQHLALPLAQARDRLCVWDLAACEPAGGSHRPEARNREEELRNLGGLREQRRLRQYVLDLRTTGGEVFLQPRPCGTDHVCAVE